VTVSSKSTFICERLDGGASMMRVCCGSSGIDQLRLWRLIRWWSAAVTVTTIVCILVADRSAFFCHSSRSQLVMLWLISTMTLLSLLLSILPPRSYAPPAPTMTMSWLLRRLRAHKRARDGPVPNPLVWMVRVPPVEWFLLFRWEALLASSSERHFT
jgi:hypothetical protein